MVFNPREVEKILPAVLDAYFRDGKMIVKREANMSGFYLDNGKIIACNFEIKEHTVQEISECVDVLIALASKEKDVETFASIIKWTMISPFSYVLKQKRNKDRCLNWFYEYGFTGAGKTTKGEIALEIWGINDATHNIGFTSVDTIARMGFAISQSTFPILVNEVPDLNNPNHRDWVEAAKNAVKNATYRSRLEGVSKKDYTQYPALSAFIFTLTYPAHSILALLTEYSIYIPIFQWRH